MSFEGDTVADFADTARDATNRVSLRVALSLLSPQQKQIIAHLAAEYPMSQISQRLGVPRATLYDDLKRIQKIFRDEGLNPYLSQSDS